MVREKDYMYAYNAHVVEGNCGVCILGKYLILGEIGLGKGHSIHVRVGVFSLY